MASFHAAMQMQQQQQQQQQQMAMLQALRLHNDWIMTNCETIKLWFPHPQHRVSEFKQSGSKSRNRVSQPKTTSRFQNKKEIKKLSRASEYQTVVTLVSESTNPGECGGGGPHRPPNHPRPPPKNIYQAQLMATATSAGTPNGGMSTMGSIPNPRDALTQTFCFESNKFDMHGNPLEKRLSKESYFVYVRGWFA